MQAVNPEDKEQRKVGLAYCTYLEYNKNPHNQMIYLGSSCQGLWMILDKLCTARQVKYD